MTEYASVNRKTSPAIDKAKEGGPNGNSPQNSGSQLDKDATLKLAQTIVKAAEDRKGDNIVLLRVEEVSYLADYFVIITGFSKTQVRAISEAILQKVEQECHRTLLHLEGQESGTWLVQDYGDVIVHILMPKEREYYNLEAFWSHAERLALPASDPDGRLK